MILNHGKFVEYMKNGENRTDSVVHIVEDVGGGGIVESKEFRYLISLFSKDVKHIVYNRNYQNKSKDYDISK